MQFIKKISRPALFSLLSLFAALDAQGKNNDETYPIRIILEPRFDAKFYQIEWLESNAIEGQSAAPENQSIRENIKKTEIRRNLPVRFKYFRLRSAYRDDLFGPWGEIVEIQRPTKSAQNSSNGQDAATNSNTSKNNASADDQATDDSNDSDNTDNAGDPEKSHAAVQKNTVSKSNGQVKAQTIDQDVFVQVIDKNGREKWVLRGSAVPAERLAQNKPLYYDVECLTEKDAPENTNGRKRYEGPVPFSRPGQYKMNLYADDSNESAALQTWIFWVYTDVPRTYVKFFAPFLHGKGGFTVGGKTMIALNPQLSPVATDKIEYRIYKEGNEAGAWLKYEDPIEVNSFAKGEYGYYTMQFQTTNVSGVTEPFQTRRMLIDATGPTIEEIPGGPEGILQLSFKDENYPIVVRAYRDGRLVEDHYFKFWNARDVVRLPANAGLTIKAIDLLGNETQLDKAAAR